MHRLLHVAAHHQQGVERTSNRGERVIHAEHQPVLRTHRFAGRTGQFDLVAAESQHLERSRHVERLQLVEHDDDHPLHRRSVLRLAHGGKDEDPTIPATPRRRRVLATPVATPSPHSSETQCFEVEVMGIEPTTPCLQSRCSSQLSYTPEGSDQHRGRVARQGAGEVFADALHERCATRQVATIPSPPMAFGTNEEPCALSRRRLRPRRRRPHRPRRPGRRGTGRPGSRPSRRSRRRSGCSRRGQGAVRPPLTR